MCVSVVWCYSMLVVTVMLAAGLVFPQGALPVIRSPLSPQGGGVMLGTTCLLQFAFSTWLDSRYDRGLGRNLFWMIWYPFAFWMINTASIVVAYPKVLRRSQGNAPAGSARTAAFVPDVDGSRLEVLPGSEGPGERDATRHMSCSLIINARHRLAGTSACAPTPPPSSCGGPG